MRKTFNHNFKGYGTHPSECAVHIIDDNDKKLIVFEDLDKGTSVTNASEQLATEIVSLEGLDFTKCKFFETYVEGLFDEVTYTWNNGEAKNPVWQPISESMHRALKLSLATL